MIAIRRLEGEGCSITKAIQQTFQFLEAIRQLRLKLEPIYNLFRSSFPVGRCGEFGRRSEVR